jgi:glycosyltransferase involved in cell wall biosynthesis
MARKILFVTYFYPPIDSIAIRRVCSWVEYLRGNGFVCDVITQNSGKASDWVERGTEGSTYWLRNPHPSLNKTSARLICLFLIDESITWIFRNFFRIVKIMKDERPEVAIITVPPGSLIFLIPIIKLLQGRKCKIVIDYRDALSLNPSFFVAYRRKGKAQKLYATLMRGILGVYERVSLRMADLRIFVTSEMKNEYDKDFTMRGKAVVIYNGFDPAEYKIMENLRNSKLTLTYAGSFVASRSPKLFFRAMEEYFASNPEIASFVRINFYTNNYDIEDEIKACLAKSRVIFNFHDKMPHDECVRKLTESDVNVLIISEKSCERGRQILTGKIFDYMKVNKPIWGIVPEGGEAHKLITYGNLGFCSRNDSSYDIKVTFERIIRLWERGELRSEYNRDYLKEFQKAKVLKDMIDVIKGLIGEPERQN